MAEDFDSIQSLLQQAHTEAEPPDEGREPSPEDKEAQEEKYRETLARFIQEVEEDRDVRKRLKKFRQEGIYSIRPWQWAVIAIGTPLALFAAFYLARAFSDATIARRAVDQGISDIYAGSFDEGIGEISVALAYGADTAEVYIQFGKALADMHQYEPALEYFQSAMALARGDANFRILIEATVRAANVSFDVGNFDRAKSYIDSVLRIDPRQRETLILQGRIELLESKFERAKESFIAALERNPSSLTPRWYLREVFLAQGNQEGAREQEEFILLTRPAGDEDFATLSGYANLLVQSGRLREAEETLVSLLQRERQKHPEIMVTLGHLAVEMNDFTKAKDYADSAIHLSPAFAGAYVLRGEIRYLQGDKSAAFEDFQKGLELDPRHPKGLYDMGSMLLFDVDAPGQARDYLERAQQNGFTGPFLWYNIGSARYLSRDYRSAVDAYQQVPDLLKQSNEFRQSFANALLLAGHPDSAIILYEEILIRRQRAPELVTNFGAALELAGDTPQALEQYWRAIKMAKDPEKANPVARANIERVLTTNARAETIKMIHPEISLRLSDVTLPSGRRGL